MATQIGQRLIFDNARRAIQEAGFSVGQAVLSQSVLRSEVTMTTTNTSYHVPVLVNDTQNGAAFNTEVRLNLQDAFVVAGVGVYVAAPTTSASTNFPLFTYPNAQVFTTANAATSLYSFYNGNMSIVVNNRQIVPVYDLGRHVKVQRTQQASSTGTNTGIDSFDASIDGVYPIEPNWLFVGSKNTNITITLPSALAAVQAGAAPRFVFKFFGVLAQNVTPVR